MLDRGKAASAIHVLQVMAMYSIVFRCTFHLAGKYRHLHVTTSTFRKLKSAKPGKKWSFLQHKGPYFPAPYEPLPKHVKFVYNNKEMHLSKDAEEMATFYAKLLDHEYTGKETFNRNFFDDWRKLMTESEQQVVTDFGKCDFTRIQEYFVAQAEKKKIASKEEKQALKEENERIKEAYGYCVVDGQHEKIGNFRIEPPGLFRGRGEHPKMGMLKTRIAPEDVIVNCSENSKIPVPPDGHQWKEVIHDNTVTWLACWKENISQTMKYVWLNAASKLKCASDIAKYEMARKLKRYVKRIRDGYVADGKSKDMRVRQTAVVIYLIDKLALRVGNEKDEDEADTVGCCSLRVEHLQLHEKKDGREYVVVFDFLGKDSIRYQNEVSVDKWVFDNLKQFCEAKNAEEEVFHKLNPPYLNRYLRTLMPGLTTKVFRTYNASVTLQNELNKYTEAETTVAEKLLQYSRANRAVAILCNHQRSVPKTFEKSMGNLKDKIESKEQEAKEVRKLLKQIVSEPKGATARSKKVLESKKRKLEKLREQIANLKMKETDKEENKTVALGTSKLNYSDPRITVAWCREHDVALEKIYNKTQREKFQWAIDSVEKQFKF